MVQFNPDGTIKPDPPQEVEARYGFVGQMAKTIPELRGILDRAVREQWTTDRFIMEVSNTNWYRTNGAAMREWMTLEATDPKTAWEKKTHGKRDVYAIASEMGITMTDKQLEEAFYYRQWSGGQSEAHFRQWLAHQYFDASKFDWENGTGLAAEYASQLDTLRQNYGMPDSEKTPWVTENLQLMMEGKQTLEGLQIAARHYASSKYSAFTEQFEAGMSVKDVALPYMDSYRRLLEQDANKGLQDDLLQKALTFKSEKGQAMATWQFEEMLRKDQRWAVTTNAKDSMAELLQEIGSNFGYFAK